MPDFHDIERRIAELEMKLAEGDLERAEMAERAQAHLLCIGVLADALMSAEVLTEGDITRRLGWAEDMLRKNNAETVAIEDVQRFRQLIQIVADK